MTILSNLLFDPAADFSATRRQVEMSMTGILNRYDAEYREWAHQDLLQKAINDALVQPTEDLVFSVQVEVEYDVVTYHLMVCERGGVDSNIRTEVSRVRGAIPGYDRLDEEEVVSGNVSTAHIDYVVDVAVDEVQDVFRSLLRRAEDNVRMFARLA